MIENKRLSSLVFIAFCAAIPALAQTQPQTRQAHTATVKARAPQTPYTVAFKTTRVYTLANGTVITTESTEVMARDKDGRRMNSSTNPPLGTRPAMTAFHVSDPVTGDEIHWDSTSKVAQDVRRPVGAARQGCWATPDGRYRANYGQSNAGAGAGAEQQPLQSPPTAAGAAMPAASPLASDPNVLTGPDGKRIVVVGVKHAPGDPVPVPVNSNRVQEDLGADTIMGVEVRGLRATITTPPGATGNDQPLVHTDEYWMAPTLGMALRSITVDPRMGKTQREAISVDLANPHPALFQPPAGYQLETEAMQPVDCPK